MILKIDVVADDFLNRSFCNTTECPMCTAAKRYFRRDLEVRAGGDYLRISKNEDHMGEKYRFIGLGNAATAVLKQEPFSFSVDVPEEFVAEEYRDFSAEEVLVSI